MAGTRPLALVTGASRGIGFELANLFAENGYDLMVAASSEAIHDAAGELRRRGVSVNPVQVDLRTEDGVRALYDAVVADGRPLSAAALNAGAGVGGAFVDADLEDLLSVVDLDVRSTVHLARLVLADMVRAGSGRVLITSSLVSKMPGPYQAVYNASKAFVQSFAEGVRNELRDSGVTVTAMLPGATDTQFFARAGLLDTVMGKAPKDDPSVVAKDGYEALMRGDRSVVAGSLLTKSLAALTTVTPKPVTTALNRVIAKPR